MHVDFHLFFILMEHSNPPPSSSNHLTIPPLNSTHKKAYTVLIFDYWNWTQIFLVFVHIEIRKDSCNRFLLA